MPDFSQFSIPKAAPAPSAAGLGLRWEFWFLRSSIAVGAASILVAGGLFGYIRVLESQYGQWVRNVRAGEEALRSPIVAELTELSGAVAAAREVLGNHRFTTNVFGFLREVTHRQVQFANFHFSDTGLSIELSGVAASFRTVAEQVSILESRPEVSSVNFGGLSAGPQGRVNFSISIAVTPGLLHRRAVEAPVPLP